MQLSEKRKVEIKPITNNIWNARKTFIVHLLHLFAFVAKGCPDQRGGRIL